MDKEHWWPLIVGLLATGAATAFVLAPGVFGRGAFSSVVALDWLRTVAIAWAGVLGVENLIELRRSREAGIQPLLDINVEISRREGRHLVAPWISNLGKGPAVGLVVGVWLSDDDDIEWHRTLVPGLPSVVHPGEQISAAIQINWPDLILKEEAPHHLIVEANFRTALGPRVERVAYRVATDARGRRKLAAVGSVGPPVSLDDEAKFRALSDVVRRLEKRFDLESARVVIQPWIDSQHVGATIRDGQRIDLKTSQPRHVSMREVEDALSLMLSKRGIPEKGRDSDRQS